MDWVSLFQGDWRLDRLVDDHFGGETMRFEGSARLSPDAEGLTYKEKGRWTGGSYAGMAASRRYLWRPEAKGIAVFFEDGRPFHSFVPAQRGRAHSGHDCAPDLYEATYEFDLPDRWTLHWRVRGPRKDYHSRSDYHRS